MTSTVTSVLAGLALAVACQTSAGAQGGGEPPYPARTIRIIVGYGPGGGTDTVARLIAQKMQESFGQNVIVENKPGGNAMIGPDYVAKASPDGYTLLFGGQGQMTVSPVIYSKMPYALKDFVPIAMMSKYPLILVVNEKHPAADLKGLVEWAKQNPDKTNYATASPAFTLASELFKLRSGAPGETIPYKSGNEQVMSVVSNQVTFTMSEPPSAVAQVSAGKVRALAVTAPARLPELPDVPTMKEAGFDVTVSLWAGLFAPAGTSAEIVKRLEAECTRISQLPDFKQKLRALSTDSPGITSEEFARAMEAELAVWRDVASQANLKFAQ